GEIRAAAGVVPGGENSRGHGARHRDPPNAEALDRIKERERPAEEDGGRQLYPAAVAEIGRPQTRDAVEREGRERRQRFGHGGTAREEPVQDRVRAERHELLPAGRAGGRNEAGPDPPRRRP